MRCAFVLFDRMTALDFIGIYDPLTRLRSMGILPAFEWRLCAVSSPVFDDRGLQFTPDVTGKPLDRFDLLVVPGGYGTRELQQDDGFLAWLRTGASIPLKASVCSGALLLGAAGFLKGKPATTHASVMRQLEPMCARVLSERVVDAGDVVTAGGVTAGIDLGLHLVQRLAGGEARERVARQMEYPIA